MRLVIFVGAALSMYMSEDSFDLQETRIVIFKIRVCSGHEENILLRACLLRPCLDRRKSKEILKEWILRKGFKGRCLECRKDASCSRGKGSYAVQIVGKKESTRTQGKYHRLPIARSSRPVPQSTVATRRASRVLDFGVVAAHADTDARRGCSYSRSVACTTRPPKLTPAMPLARPRHACRRRQEERDSSTAGKIRTTRSSKR
jgi:hypothetical protein